MSEPIAGAGASSDPAVKVRRIRTPPEARARELKKEAARDRQRRPPEARARELKKEAARDRQRRPVEFPAVVVNGDEPATLLDLRHVYNRPVAEDRTPGQFAARRIFNADAGKFMDRLNAAEASYKKERATEGTSGVSGPSMAGESVLEDAGSEAVSALLSRLLKGE